MGNAGLQRRRSHRTGAALRRECVHVSPLTRPRDHACGLPVASQDVGRRKAIILVSDRSPSQPPPNQWLKQHSFIVDKLLVRSPLLGSHEAGTRLSAGLCSSPGEKRLSRLIRGAGQLSPSRSPFPASRQPGTGPCTLTPPMCLLVLVTWSPSPNSGSSPSCLRSVFPPATSPTPARENSLLLGAHGMRVSVPGKPGTDPLS